MCGSNPVAAITDPISEVLGTSGGGGGILGAVEDVGQAIGDVGESFDKAVTQPIGQGLSEVDQFVNREIPGGWVLPAAVTAAIAAPYLAPALAAEGAGAAAFTGATETGLATLAGEGALADTVGTALLAGVPEATIADLATAGALEGATELAAAASEALPYTEAFDAVNLANQGLGTEQIAQNLTISAGTDPFIAQDIATMASNGLSPEAIIQNLQYSYSAQELAPLGLESKAATLAAKSLLTPSMALQAARLGGGLLSGGGMLGGGGQRPQPMLPSGQQRNIIPQGAVDYSGILNLLAPRMASRNPNSLLG